MILPVEIFLRIKYKNYESNTYLYTRGNFHPFLQFQSTPETMLPINAYGFRGTEIQLHKPKGTYRIFVLGGSTVFNRQLPYERTPTRILEELLRKRYPGKRIEVINAGYDAFTTEHSLIWYLFKIKDFAPDLIVMWHGVNDLYYSCSPSDRAYGSYKSDYSHFFGAEGNMVSNYFSLPAVINIRLLSVDFLMKFVKDNAYSDVVDYLRKQHGNAGIYSNTPPNRQYTMENFPSLAAYQRNVLSLVKAAKSDNVPLILGNQAFLYNKKLTKNELSTMWIPAAFCSKDNKIPTLSSFYNGLGKFNQATKVIADQNNIPFVDLENALPKSFQYFSDDVHYTAKGSNEIANVLFDKIVKLNLIH